MPWKWLGLGRQLWRRGESKIHDDEQCLVQLAVASPAAIQWVAEDTGRESGRDDRSRGSHDGTMLMQWRSGLITSKRGSGDGLVFRGRLSRQGGWASCGGLST